MNSEFSRLAVTVRCDESIDATLKAMGSGSRAVIHAGLALVFDKENDLQGILTDGDLRRAYAKEIPFSSPVSDIMVRDPISVSVSIPKDQIIPEVYRQVRKTGRHNSEWVRHILVRDEAGKIVDVLDFFDLLQSQGRGLQIVAVFGLGFVGLTLAVALANRGHQVTGVDIRDDVLAQLANGIPHIHEPGLREMLKTNLARDQITFDRGLGGHRHGVYIISVGTPLDSAAKPDLTALNQVVDAIGPLLKRGDQVMLRSTVPMGTTRKVVVPRLERLSGLRAGEDFHVAFAPERTIEGKAMHELRTLPQIVGGLTAQCARRASEFWATLTPSVVQTSSLEAGELVKLANNTFRDLSFAFANELALLADRYNVDAFDLIRAANEGYPRNPIPLPSPGVGGYCLTKDPVLFSCTPDGLRPDAVLGLAGRQVNERAGLHAIALVDRFAQRIKKPLSAMNVLIVGVAFKGDPETTDMRGSVAVDVARALSGRPKNLWAWDAVVVPEEMRAVGLKPALDLDRAILESDVVLILNNHRLNVASEAYVAPAKARLIFDGWHQLDSDEIEKVEGLVYSTMGYMTP